jgi:hypothetical protein
VAVGYLAVAVILFACQKYAVIVPHPVELSHGAEPAAAE